MKPMNWISATGRRPVSAMPNAVPTMADSASGVSNTRLPPNCACSPSVARKTPPSWPTSWPITTTRGSLASACCSARLIACTMTVSATTMRGLDVAREGRRGRRFGGGDGAIDVLKDLRAGFLLGRCVHDQAPLEIRAQARQRIALTPGVDLVGGLVAARLADRPLVVLDEDDRLGIEDAREVQPFQEVAL